MKTTLQKNGSDINVLVDDKVYAYLLARGNSFQITWIKSMDFEDQVQVMKDLKIAIALVQLVMKKKDVIVTVDDGKVV